MKTAMQELIEWLDIAIEELKGNDSTDFAAGLVAARVKANELLYQEKYEIINAVNAGDSTSFWEAYNNAEDYYNQSYNQNK
jgi:hypothetical protein